MTERSRVGGQWTTRKVDRHWPSWSAQDHNAIARTIAGFNANRPSIETITEAFADLCEHTHPYFNRELFIEVCRGER